MLGLFENPIVIDILITTGVILGFIVLRVILKSLLFKRNGFEKEESRKALVSFLNWLMLYAILVFLLLYFSESDWMSDQLFAIGDVEISLLLIVIAVFIITLANRLSRIFTSLLMPPLYDHYRLDTGLQFTFNRIFHYSLMVIAVIISLTTVGIDLSVLTVFAGVLGVGIGFGMQNIANNFISGLIILFERPIKVGDRVIINDIIGDVEKNKNESNHYSHLRQ